MTVRRRAHPRGDERCRRPECSRPALIERPGATGRGDRLRPGSSGPRQGGPVARVNPQRAVLSVCGAAFIAARRPPSTTRTAIRTKTAGPDCPIVTRTGLLNVLSSTLWSQGQLHQPRVPHVRKDCRTCRHNTRLCAGIDYIGRVGLRVKLRCLRSSRTSYWTLH